jgi:hypothetical protein
MQRLTFISSLSLSAAVPTYVFEEINKFVDIFTTAEVNDVLTRDERS